MDIKILIRGAAYVVLAGALLVAAVASNDRRYPTPSASNGYSSPNPGGLASELVSCKAIGTEVANGAVCKAIWEANRERFPGPKKLYRDRVTDAVPAASELKPALAAGEEQPKSASRLPTMHNSTAARAPSDTAGPPR